MVSLVPPLLTFGSSGFGRQLAILRQPQRPIAHPMIERNPKAWRWAMLWTLFVILLVVWLIGVVSSYTLGGFIHLLLVVAVLALVFQLISDRRSAA
jgi:hypothetical protein